MKWFQGQSTKILKEIHWTAREVDRERGREREEKRGGDNAQTPKNDDNSRWRWPCWPLSIHINSAHTPHTGFFVGSPILPLSHTRSLSRSHSRCDRKLISRQLSQISWPDPALRSPRHGMGAVLVTLAVRRTLSLTQAAPPQRYETREGIYHIL